MITLSLLKRYKGIHTNSDYFTAPQLFRVFDILAHKSAYPKLAVNFPDRLLGFYGIMNAYRELIRQHLIIARSISLNRTQISFTPRGQKLSHIYWHYAFFMLISAAGAIVSSMLLANTACKWTAFIMLMIFGYLFLSWPFLYFYCLPNVIHNYIEHGQQRIRWTHTLKVNQVYLPEIRIAITLLVVTIVFLLIT